MPAHDPPPPGDDCLDVRQIPFWRRLDAIIAACDRLQPGDSLLLVVEVDPWPLRQYLEATRRTAFDWQYVESGPRTWRVRVIRLAD
jgi:uncharacterized protein (DUF2249 family)